MKNFVMIVMAGVMDSVFAVNVPSSGPDVDMSANRVRTKLDVDMTLLGTLKMRSTSEIGESDFMVGCETVDRDYTDFACYKKYLPYLGIRKLRIQAGWARCEQEKGIFDFRWLDKIVDWCVVNGFEPMMCCVFGNPLYADPTAKGLFAAIPHEGEAYRAWQRWIDTLARHYAGRVRDFETWNEPNNVTGNTFDIIADNNIETAEIIRRYIPDACITGMCLGSRKNNAFCEIAQAIARRGKSNLFTFYSVHLYDMSPEAKVDWVDQALADLKRIAPTVRLRNSEAGMVSEMIPRFGFSGWPMTEITQAKWDMRRMLVDHSRGVNSSVFAISDMHYSGVEGEPFNNAKGLLRANNRCEIIQIKKAFYAVQNVVNVFDHTRTLVPKTESSFVNLNTSVWFDEYRSANGEPLVVFWQWQTHDAVNHSRATVLSDACQTRTFMFERKGAALRNPVWVDLLSGRVYELPQTCQIVHSAGVTFVNIPVYDSPVVLTERTAIPIVEHKP